jgi:hypothetical protein
MDHAAKCTALTALAVVGFLKQEVSKYAAPADLATTMREVLAAANTSVDTPDLAVLSVLTYPTK